MSDRTDEGSNEGSRDGGAIRSVCVFCGSRSGTNPAFSSSATALGQSLARRRQRLVYGGGNVGLMGILADAAIDAGGEVVGVIPAALLERELGHGSLTELRVVQTMHERKAMMADLSGAFVAMPGGFGTLDELCEILTWAQLGLHAKPVGLLNVAGYFDAFLEFLLRATRDGFLHDFDRELFLVDEDPDRLVEQLLTAPPRKARTVDDKIDRRVR